MINEASSPGASLEQGCRPESGAVEDTVLDFLEAAQEPSRALDAMIDAGETYEPRVVVCTDEAYRGRVYVDFGGKSAWLDEIPEYTKSIDAAARLVPDGVVWTVSNYCGAFVHPKNGVVHGEHKWPAMALCIAALKATASMKVGTPSSETLSR